MSIRTEVLLLMEKLRGRSISGEEIAKQLNVSRNAVWKAVKELQRDGHDISAVRNKGYCLSQLSDIISAEGIAPFLLDESVASKIIVYDSIHSTNSVAKELALSGADHGTVVIADTQTAGRGRYGRRFYSPKGSGIYMSFILRTKQLEFETATIITALAAVNVCKAIESLTSKKPCIKWVNDIYLDGKKTSGILSEAVIDVESKNIDWMAIGIGINFKIPDAGFPDEINELAGAIFTDEKPTITRNRLIAEIINRFLYSQEHQNKETVIKEYKQRLMILGKKVIVTSSNKNYEAWAVDIDEVGHLIVRNDNGQLFTLSAGEVSIKI